MNVKEDMQKSADLLNMKQQELQDSPSPAIKNETALLTMRLDCLKTLDKMGIVEFVEAPPSNDKVVFWKNNKKEAALGYYKAKEELAEKGLILDVWTWVTSENIYAYTSWPGAIEAYFPLESVQLD